LGYFKVNAEGLVEANVEVTHYSGDTFSVFGNLKQFQLKVSGKVNTPEMQLEWTVL
jgi:hypothetical protein